MKISSNHVFWALQLNNETCVLRQENSIELSFVNPNNFSWYTWSTIQQSQNNSKISRKYLNNSNVFLGPVAFSWESIVQYFFQLTQNL